MLLGPAAEKPLPLTFSIYRICHCPCGKPYSLFSWQDISSLSSSQLILLTWGSSTKVVVDVFYFMCLSGFTEYIH